MVSPFNAFQPKSSSLGVNSDEMTEDDSSSTSGSSCPAVVSLHGHVGFVSVAHPLARSVTKNPMNNGKAIGHILRLFERFIGVSRVTRERLSQANGWFSVDIQEYWQIMYS
jgi:hypothetical protein